MKKIVLSLSIISFIFCNGFLGFFESDKEYAQQSYKNFIEITEEYLNNKIDLDTCYNKLASKIDINKLTTKNNVRDYFVQVLYLDREILPIVKHNRTKGTVSGIFEDLGKSFTGRDEEERIMFNNFEVTRANLLSAINNL